MKFLILLIITSFNIYATESVVVPAQNLYTPQGFDTNDETQVVVSGYLPSLPSRLVRLDLRYKILIKVISLLF